MSAIIHVYTDESCTTQLGSLASQYTAFIGPEIGLDGDTGELCNKVYYMKNEGDQKALFVRAIVNSDEYHYVSISVDGLYYETDNYVEIAAGVNNDHSMAIGDIVPLYVKIQIPPGTEAAQWNPNIVVSFKTLP